MPRRNLPWGDPHAGSAAIGMANASEPPDVGSHPADRSPYGVLDLAGSVTEWTMTPVDDDPGTNIVRGGNYGETDEESLLDYTALENQRTSSQIFLVGMRCVSSR